MNIERIELTNFKSFKKAELILDRKSTVLFGINGTGKSSVLKSINLLYASIINQIVNRKELRQNYALSLEDIQYGKAETKIKAEFNIEGERIVYHRSLIRKNGRRMHNKENLKLIADYFQNKYMSEEHQENIPIFVNYGTNRLVLDVPLRIRTHHEFDIYSAFEKSIENKIDFRTFFEWFRDQEDYENHCKVEYQNLDYIDKSLEAVRKAVLVMLDDCENLRVARKPRLQMRIDKNGIGLNITQLSDGEKCTMALFGDLARRLTIANPMLENPLLGDGVVLIDEIELHMHPSWQRKILRKLRETFPNIQFIITTHSPLVLNEVNEDFNIYFLQNNGAENELIKLDRMDGFDANYILEEFMGTKSMNPRTEILVNSIYHLIEKKRFDEAQEKVDELEKLTDVSNKDVLRANMLIKRGRLL